MKKQLASIAFLAAVGSQLGATDCGEIIEDPGFDHWCGGDLCYWKTERGDIQQVPTWRDGDDGVEFVGADVAISQMTAVTSNDTDCIRFEFLADVADTVEVNLEADVFGDGTIDWVERVPTSRWEKVSFRIGIEGTYQGILFRLTKVGDGRTVLAQIRAHEEDGCPTYVDIASRPLGASCPGDEACDSGICWGLVCSSCDASTDCGAGAVCGRENDAPGHLGDWHTCVPEASRAIGDLCFADAECASGACNGLLCSECKTGLLPCPGGETCSWAAETVPVDVCAPGAGGRAAGADCVLDGDCASGVCDGRGLGTCDEYGWSVCYEDDDCPDVPGVSPGVCTFQAVAGGTCQ